MNVCNQRFIFNVIYTFTKIYTRNKKKRNQKSPSELWWDDGRSLARLVAMLGSVPLCCHLLNVSMNNWWLVKNNHHKNMPCHIAILSPASVFTQSIHATSPLSYASYLVLLVGLPMLFCFVFVECAFSFVLLLLLLLFKMFSFMVKLLAAWKRGIVCFHLLPLAPARTTTTSLLPHHLLHCVDLSFSFFLDLKFDFEFLFILLHIFYRPFICLPSELIKLN